MRFVISALLFLHGLIHLMGFVKPWGFAEVPQLSGPTDRGLGLLWLLTALLLVIAAVLRAIDRDAWWAPAALGVVLSQALILSQWSDARAGTLANVLLAIPIVVGVATARFHQQDEEHALALLASAPRTTPAIVTADELAPLPAPVRRWLETSGVVGKPRARTVRVLQRGGMRTSPDAAFMPARATQYFTVDEPGFVWTVDVTMKGLPVVGRDTFTDGRGHMLIKVGGLITVADGTGEKFDQGTLLRFLGETVWFPSAALSPWLRWEPIDEHSARATMSWKGTTGSATFEFDERGRVKGLFARRYFDGKTLEDWRIPITAWKALRGVEVPTQGGAVWKLASGDFDYYHWEILDVETNTAELWRAVPEAPHRARVALAR